MTYTAQRNEIEAELARTSSPLIADFIARMREDMAATRKKIALSVSTQENWLTGHKSQTATSNAARIRGRLLAISAAIESAEDAKLIADQSGVPDLLFRLEAELPPIEEI